MNFAQATFSESVQNVVEANNDVLEAEWCRLIRHWYRAVDEAGVPGSSSTHKVAAANARETVVTVQVWSVSTT